MVIGRALAKCARLQAGLSRECQSVPAVHLHATPACMCMRASDSAPGTHDLHAQRHKHCKLVASVAAQALPKPGACYQNQQRCHAAVQVRCEASRGLAPEDTAVERPTMRPQLEPAAQLTSGPLLLTTLLKLSASWCTTRAAGSWPRRA